MEEKKTLYDHNIKFDIEHLPKSLQDDIKVLEKYSDEGDWINYDEYFSAVEGHLKNHLINKRITEYDFKIIMRKYGGYVD